MSEAKICSLSPHRVFGTAANRLRLKRVADVARTPDEVRRLSIAFPSLLPAFLRRNSLGPRQQPRSSI